MPAPRWCGSWLAASSSTFWLIELMATSSFLSTLWWMTLHAVSMDWFRILVKASKFCVGTFCSISVTVPSSAIARLVKRACCAARKKANVEMMQGPYI